MYKLAILETIVRIYMAKFNPLDSNLEVWVPSSSNEVPIKPWTREDAITRSHECGVIGHILRTQCDQDEDPEFFDDVINMIIYFQAKERHLYNAFFKGLNLSDVLTIQRENMDGNIEIRGEIIFHKILVYGICLNLDRPGFSNYEIIQMTVNYKSYESNKIRRFLFKSDQGDLLFLEIIKDCIAVKAPYADISYTGETNGHDDNIVNGPIIPVRYHYHSREEKIGDRIKNWLSDEHWLAFGKDDGCNEVVIQTLLSMLQTASDRILDSVKQEFKEESSGFFNLSYLYVVDPNDPKVAGFGYIKCSKASCTNHSTKHCGRCSSPYCSSACQRDHYHEHKSYCKSIVKLSDGSNSRIDNRSSILIDDSCLSSFVKKQSDNDNRIIMSFSMNGSGHYSETDIGKIKIKHIDGEFIVKVQGNISPKCTFLVYDEYRRIDNISFESDTVPGKILYDFLKDKSAPYPNQSVYHALQKCFLYARTEVEGIRIFITDQFAPWQKW